MSRLFRLLACLATALVGVSVGAACSQNHASDEPMRRRCPVDECSDTINQILESIEDLRIDGLTYGAKTDQGQRIWYAMDLAPIYAHLELAGQVVVKVSRAEATEDGVRMNLVACEFDGTVVQSDSCVEAAGTFAPDPTSESARLAYDAEILGSSVRLIPSDGDVILMPVPQS